MSLHAALTASDVRAALDDGWDLNEASPVASTPVRPPPRPEPAPGLDDGWGLADEFSNDELAFFDAGDHLARTAPAPVETFDDLPEPPRRSFWQRLLSRQ
jgi:hypothetical protein